MALCVTTRNLLTSVSSSGQLDLRTQAILDTRGVGDSSRRHLANTPSLARTGTQVSGTFVMSVQPARRTEKQDHAVADTMAQLPSRLILASKCETWAFPASAIFNYHRFVRVNGMLSLNGYASWRNSLHH